MNAQSDECGQNGGRDGGDTPVLRTTRLILRAPRLEDTAAICEIANNRRIAEQTRRLPFPYGVEDARQWIEGTAGPAETKYLIVRASDGAILGAAGHGFMNGGEMEVGYWIGEPYWGNGFATEALRAVIDRIFSDGKLDQLFGRCRVSNRASRAVLVKCGFQLVGAGMSDSRVLSGLVPVEEFQLERSVWRSLKKWGAA
ncbi:ribosomal-protein-serine acetyltransferase [bacterium BMS3Bbin10]|nr:ribosomal-protein-serine acetyltransferase [bacterium BMS3Bbin10]HDL17256.1 N-acetyltransferase [Hyphomicrobiales bacterium]